MNETLWWTPQSWISTPLARWLLLNCPIVSGAPLPVLDHLSAHLFTPGCSSETNGRTRHYYRIWDKHQTLTGTSLCIRIIFTSKVSACMLLRYQAARAQRIHRKLCVQFLLERDIMHTFSCQFVLLHREQILWTCYFSSVAFPFCNVLICVNKHQVPKPIIC